MDTVLHGTIAHERELAHKWFLAAAGSRGGRYKLDFDEESEVLAKDYVRVGLVQSLAEGVELVRDFKQQAEAQAPKFSAAGTMAAAAAARPAPLRFSPPPRQSPARFVFRRR